MSFLLTETSSQSSKTSSRSKVCIYKYLTHNTREISEDRGECGILALLSVVAARPTLEPDPQQCQGSTLRTTEEPASASSCSTRLYSSVICDVALVMFSLFCFRFCIFFLRWSHVAKCFSFVFCRPDKKNTLTKAT